MKPWRSPAEFRKLAAAIAAVVAVSGCGDDDEAAEGPSTTARPPEGGKPDAGPQLRQGHGVSEATGAYVGKVTGKPDIYASVTTLRNVDGEGREFAAVYLCDGKEVAEILLGLVRTEGKITAVSRGGGNVALERQGSKYVGSGVLGNGTRVMFVASSVEVEGPAGFYLATSEHDRSFRTGDYGGWVVLPDRTQRGAIVQKGTVMPGGTLDTSTRVVSVGSRTIRPGSERFSNGTCA
jgi:hypothetical protein